jgi:hypothetical protein
MKKLLLLILSVFTLFDLSAQCTELFISEYVEGTYNNRAIELYNPTNKRIALKDYSIGRFRDYKSPFFSPQAFDANDFIEPYNTFVTVLDKRAPGTGLESPTWNGYQKYDTCRDQQTGKILIDSITGKVRFCVQYEKIGTAVEPIIGTVYRDTFDLQCRANKFANPFYDATNLVKTPMYFNGNDPVALIKGADVNNTGSNIIDMVGVIGEDVGLSWKDYRGFDLTQDRTLVRKRDVKVGTGLVAFVNADTFKYNQYLVLPQNTFSFLGKHICDCNPSTTQINQGKCGTSSVEEFIIGFNMYPNPASQNINIIAPENFQSLEVYNMVGKTIQFTKLSNQNTYGMDISKYENGVYFMKLTFDNNHYGIQKLIIQKP